MFRIKELAEARGLNISTLGNKANMTYSQVYAIWNNKRQRPALATLERIAQALEVPIWALFEGAPDPPA